MISLGRGSAAQLAFLILNRSKHPYELGLWPRLEWKQQTAEYTLLHVCAIQSAVFNPGLVCSGTCAMWVPVPRSQPCWASWHPSPAPAPPAEPSVGLSSPSQTAPQPPASRLCVWSLPRGWVKGAWQAQRSSRMGQVTGSAVGCGALTRLADSGTPGVKGHRGWAGKQGRGLAVLWTGCGVQAGSSQAARC